MFPLMYSETLNLKYGRSLAMPQLEKISLMIWVVCVNKFLGVFILLNAYRK